MNSFDDEFRMRPRHYWFGWALALPVAVADAVVASSRDDPWLYLYAVVLFGYAVWCRHRAQALAYREWLWRIGAIK